MLWAFQSPRESRQYQGQWRSKNYESKNKKIKKDGALARRDQLFQTRS